MRYAFVEMASDDVWVRVGTSIVWSDPALNAVTYAVEPEVVNRTSPGSAPTPTAVGDVPDRSVNVTLFRSCCVTASVPVEEMRTANGRPRMPVIRLDAIP